MRRTIGLTILGASMIVFTAGGVAIPSARQWIADDYNFKTETFLIGGVIVMIIAATMACFTKSAKEMEYLRKIGLLDPSRRPEPAGEQPSSLTPGVVQTTE
jgi:hypothetical protein